MHGRVPSQPYGYFLDMLRVFLTVLGPGSRMDRRRRGGVAVCAAR